METTIWQPRNAALLVALAGAASAFAAPPGGRVPGPRVTLADADHVVRGDTLARWAIANPTGERRTVALEWELFADSRWADAVAVDPELGLDHAVGAKARLTIGGRDAGDPKVTDGDPHTSFESAWTGGHGDAVVDIDLGVVRSITAMRWLAADANWIYLVDVSSSADGQNYQPVRSLQGFDMHKKWGEQRFPLAGPLEARHLRFRFHRKGGVVNIVRLPCSIEVYDGAENDAVDPPKVGPSLAKGTARAEVPAGGTATVAAPRPTTLAPGAFLLTWRLPGQAPAWANWMMLPADVVDKRRTRRFGVNGADPRHAAAMAACGFGWVRFENAKWMMFCDRPDRYSFDGGVAPWHVNQDAIYAGYRRVGMETLPYVFQTPEWANSAGPDVKQNRAGHPPRDPRDYGEAVFQLIARYGRRKVEPNLLRTADKRSGLGLLHAVELWNEPNLVGPTWAAFVGPLDNYFDVLRAGAEGARRADPEVLVSSCGWAGIEVATVDQMRTHRYRDGKTPLDLVDIVNVHFYSGREEPELCVDDPNERAAAAAGRPRAYPERLRDLVAWRDRHKPAAKIWLTETGNDVGGPIGLSERKQAAKLPRAVMLALAAGVEKVFIYRETGSTPTMHAGAGLLRDDGTHRPSWLTMATLMRKLGGVEYHGVRRLPHPNPDIWAFEWRIDDRRVVAAWSIKKGATVTPAELGIVGGVDAASDAFGADLRAEVAAGRIELGEFPVYLTVNAPSGR